MFRRLLFFVIGIVMGTSIGAAISVLFTPAAGKDMRRGTREHFHQAVEESARAAARRREELEAELAAMKKRHLPQEQKAAE